MSDKKRQTVVRKEYAPERTREAVYQFKLGEIDKERIRRSKKLLAL